MVDALIEFDEGDDILASQTNSNNKFLLSKITDISEQLQSYLETQIASIQSNIASVQSTLQQNINTVKNSALTSSNKVTITQWGMPKYKSKANRSTNTNYTASGNGYLYIRHGENNDAKFKVTVDGVEAAYSYGWKYTTSVSVIIPIAKGSVYKVTEYSNVVSCYWIPAQGG